MTQVVAGILAIVVALILIFTAAMGRPQTTDTWESWKCYQEVQVSAVVGSVIDLPLDTITVCKRHRRQVLPNLPEEFRVPKR